MSRQHPVCLLLTFVTLFLLMPWPPNCAAAQDPSRPSQAKPLILVHYMPWFQANPTARQWGWHWTMNKFDPNRVIGANREIASHFNPVIGPYDSADPYVIEYHLLLMKLAGIDGIIIDWYGLEDFRDHALLQKHTRAIVDATTRLGLKFAICYEDQIIPALVEAGKLKREDRVAHATRELSWLDRNWFPRPNYVRVDGKPILLSFGQTGLTDPEWTACLDAVGTPIAYYSQHHRRSRAVGAFDWPVPGEGLAASRRFAEVIRTDPRSIPVAYPRFVDIYAQAGVHKSWGRIEDNGGKTFTTSLEQALSAKTPLIQIATWNDWGEGTNIEPSREFGERDLRALQEARRRWIDARFPFTRNDLNLPLQLWRKRQTATMPERHQRLDRIALQIAQGDLKQAAISLEGDQQ